MASFKFPLTLSTVGRMYCRCLSIQLRHWSSWWRVITVNPSQFPKINTGVRATTSCGGSMLVSCLSVETLLSVTPLVCRGVTEDRREDVVNSRVAKHRIRIIQKAPVAWRATCSFLVYRRANRRHPFSLWHRNFPCLYNTNIIFWGMPEPCNSGRIIITFFSTGTLY